MMKTHYTQIFITNIPSFYKLNLYNEISQHQSIFVLFTGDVIQERKGDFFSGEYKFDYESMSNLSLFSKLRKVHALITKVSYDELVVCGWDSIPLLFAALISPSKKNSTVIESSDLESNMAGIRGFVKRMYMKRISKVYASGKSQVRLARKMGFNGYDIAVTKGVGIFNYIKQPEFQAKDKVSKFIYVGRLSEEKNLNMLVRVFNRHSELELNIVGYGHQEMELKAIAHDNIHFLGSINNKELSGIYQKNDVFVLPSSVEPWGLVVEEALNNGLPILLSNKVGCAEEILEQGENGFSFAFDSELSLEEAINKITDIEKYNYMRKYISAMDFSIIEQNQIKCYLHG